MAYQALYRQWRPRDFSTMVGQEAIIATLRNQIMTGRIAHAYLFCGSRGTGKTSTAKIMARAINCLDPHDGDPCGECESCKRLMDENSLDILEFDAASNSRVEDMRDLLDAVKYPPQYGKYKVYIIDEVHMLSASAFNALLKTLEEPPAHVVFILATTEPQKLPATILSRCQRFDFGRIPAEQIVGRLREAVTGASGTASDQALHLIARAAEGGMRDALSILDMCLGYQSEVTEDLVRTVLGTADRAFLFRFAVQLQESNVAGVMTMIDELMRSGREPLVFSKDVSQHLRSLMLARTCEDDLERILEITAEDAAEYRTQAEGFTDQRLIRMLELFMQVETDMRWASSPRIALEAAAMKACLRTQEADTAALTERIGELEKQLTEITEKIKSGELAPAKQAKAAHPPAAAPVRPAQPTIARPAVLSPTGKSPDEAWKSMLDLVKRQSPGTFGPLLQGRLGDFDGKVFHWYGPRDKDFFLGLLNKDATRQMIADALSTALGMDVKFEAMPEPLAQEELRAQEDDGFLSQLGEAFGRENLVVKEEPNP